MLKFSERVSDLEKIPSSFISSRKSLNWSFTCPETLIYLFEALIYLFEAPIHLFF